ncbi:MAG TPA: 4-(cytidine 5'-diphospho)-2-C-methyl-D-erythritol kinase [Actinomycetes bacterium]|jgi:4-diphosphocytidyl-2-C-methyl-D-erythritol kinase
MSSVTARAPAKVNLELAVGGPRLDGYHDLATAYHAISLYDEVIASDSDELTVSMSAGTGIPVDDVPEDESNLAAAAALALARYVGREARVALHITKGIPVAGGMAGGSADAAAALVACDALWGTGLSRAELAELATGLGSDVPFSLLGGTAMGTGRGEVLAPVLARGRFEWVAALAEDGLSTPAVYRELDRLRGGRAVPEPRVSDGLMAALRAGDADELGRAMRNDLQDAACALRPVLRQTLDTGREAGALGAMVSGSGPTVVFLARSPEHAIDIAVALSATGTCRAVKRAHGPVGGARVVGD